MGQYNGKVGGVSGIATDGFKAWWEGIDGTVAAYHGDETLTAKEAYERVLNWKVSAKDVYVDLGDAEHQILTVVEDKLAVVGGESGTNVLGIHSKGYSPIQNETLLDFAEALKTLGDVYVKSAGHLYDEKVVWFLVKLGEDKHFADQDEKLQRYLLLASSHDGSIAFSARPTNVRVECMNTFDWAVKGSTALFTVRHTVNANETYVPQAKDALKSAYNHFDAIDREIEELLNTIHTRKDFTDKLVPALIGDEPEEEGRAKTLFETRRDGIISAWDRPDQANISGTAWGATMAVNSWEVWNKPVRGVGRAEAQARNAVQSNFPLTSKARKLLLTK